MGNSRILALSTLVGNPATVDYDPAGVPIFYLNRSLKNGWKARLELRPAAVKGSYRTDQKYIEIPAEIIVLNPKITSEINDLPIGLEKTKTLELYIDLPALQNIINNNLVTGDGSVHDYMQILYDSIVYSTCIPSHFTIPNIATIKNADCANPDIPYSGTFLSNNNTSLINLQIYNTWILYTDRGSNVYQKTQGEFELAAGYNLHTVPTFIEGIFVQKFQLEKDVDLSTDISTVKFEMSDAIQWCFEQLQVNNLNCEANYIPIDWFITDINYVTSPKGYPVFEKIDQTKVTGKYACSVDNFFNELFWKAYYIFRVFVMHDTDPTLAAITAGLIGEVFIASVEADEGNEVLSFATTKQIYRKVFQKKMKNIIDTNNTIVHPYYFNNYFTQTQSGNFINKGDALTWSGSTNSFTRTSNNIYFLAGIINYIPNNRPGYYKLDTGGFLSGSHFNSYTIKTDYTNVDLKNTIDIGAINKPIGDDTLGNLYKTNMWDFLIDQTEAGGGFATIYYYTDAVNLDSHTATNKMCWFYKYDSIISNEDHTTEGTTNLNNLLNLVYISSPKLKISYNVLKSVKSVQTGMASNDIDQIKNNEWTAKRSLGDKTWDIKDICFWTSPTSGLADNQTSIATSDGLYQEDALHNCKLFYLIDFFGKLGVRVHDQVVVFQTSYQKTVPSIINTLPYLPAPTACGYEIIPGIPGSTAAPPTFSYDAKDTPSKDDLKKIINNQQSYIGYSYSLNNYFMQQFTRDDQLLITCDIQFEYSGILLSSTASADGYLMPNSLGSFIDLQLLPEGPGNTPPTLYFPKGIEDIYGTNSASGKFTHEDLVLLKSEADFENCKLSISLFVPGTSIPMNY